jgi:hypothetical protein
MPPSGPPFRKKFARFPPQMSDRERRLFDALRELVEQVENSNARDDHGHPLKNLKALRDARSIIDQVEGA